MRTLAALAIAALGYRAAALFAATVSFPWLGVAVMTFLMAFCHVPGREYRRANF